MSSQKPLPKTPITRDELIRTNVAMLVLTSGFVASRIAVRVWNHKAFELPDFFIYVSFALYVALWICYAIAMPPMFRVFAVVDHEVPPYKTMMEDAALMLRLITAAQMCFYTTLLSVKLSFLTLYRKLLKGLPTRFINIWYAIVAFCLLFWLGSVFSSIFTCDNLNKKYSKGRCGGTRNEDRRIIFSLYFAYAVDVATNLAIMSLPLYLTWNLQMPKAQKIGIFVLFGSGFICIAFATLRVVQLGVDGRGRTTTPEPKWMLLWTVLECTIAIIIGCSPAFTMLIHKRLESSKKTSHNDRRYFQQTERNDIRMENIISATLRSTQNNMDAYRNDAHGSQDELAVSAGWIVVRATKYQYDEWSCRTPST